MKPKPNIIALLSLAAIGDLTVTQTSLEFSARVKTRQRAFVEQGKLLFHLRGLKLKPGQSVYSILQGQGVPEGSVQQAVATADIIEKLVIPGHLAETRFDEVITFRICRQARRLLSGKGDTKLVLAAEAVAALLVTGESAAIGAELDCLCEHGMTIAERETHLADKVAETEKLKLAAAEAEKIKAADELRKATEAAATALAEAEKAKAAALFQGLAGLLPTNGTDTNDEESHDSHDSPPSHEPTAAPAAKATPAPTPEAEAEAEAEENYAPASIANYGRRETPPPAPSLTDITGRMNDALTDAMNLGPDDMKGLLAYLRNATADIAAVCDSMVEEMAA